MGLRRHADRRSPLSLSARSRAAFRGLPRAATWLCLVAATACGGSAEESAPAGPAWADTLAALDVCPTGDSPWLVALYAATDPERNAELSERAIELAGACPERWEPAWIAGGTHLDRGDLEGARLWLERALERASRDAPVGRAHALHDLGVVAVHEGDLEAARARLDASLEEAVRAGRADIEAGVRNSLAGWFIEVGDFAAALRQLGRAEPVFARDNPTAHLYTRFNRGVLLLELGDAARARTVLEDAREAAAELGDTHTEDAATLALGNLELALDRADAAHARFERIGERHRDIAVRARVGAGRAALASGELERAAALLAGAVETAGDDDRILASVAECHLAEAERRRGRADRARARLREVASRAETDGSVEPAWMAAWLLGRLELESGRVDSAKGHFDRAIAALEASRRELDFDGDGLRFLRERVEPYVDAAVACAREDAEPRLRARCALELSSRVKARGLRETLAPGREGAFAGVDRLARLMASLPEDAVVVDYLVGEERSVATIVEGSAARVVELPGRRRWMDAFRAARDDANPDGRDAAHAALAQALLVPLGVDFAGRRVWIVPDREVVLVPFESLPVGEHTLGAIAEPVLIPTAGIARAPRVGDGRVFLAGRPEFGDDGSFEDLPWSGLELSRVRETWGPTRVDLLFGDELTAEGFEGRDLRDVAVLHVATHATASTLDPDRNGVVLSHGDRLGIDDVRELDLDGAIVVLSACRTGEGEIVPGEGAIGLVWAFLQAGAHAVVASRSDVDDRDTARFMVSLHERLHGGDDVVRALTHARRAREASGRDPGFVVVVRSEGV